MSDVIDSSAPAPAPAAPAPSPAPAAPAPAPAPAPSALGAAAPSASPSPAPAPEAPPAVPDKFIVKDANGQVDHAATALKLSASYAGLEKRFGAGDVRPETAEGYKVNVPDAFKDKADALAKDESFKAVVAGAHAKGYSQAQLDFAVAEMLTGGGMAADPAKRTAECIATLKSVDGWKTDGEYSQQVGHIRSAAKAFSEKAGVSVDEVLAGIDNNPVLMRFLAAIGPEVAEDRGASPEAQAQIQANLDTLMADPAYLNDRHPKHATLVAQVEALTKQQVGARPVGAGMSHSFKS